MPQPTLSDVHVDRPLSNILIAFMQKQEGFVADRVFPNIPVPKKSDKYFEYQRGDWFRSQMEERPPGTESAGSGFTPITSTYDATDFALHKDIADQIRGNQDVPLNLERDATNWLGLQALLKREKTWVTAYFTTSLWTGAADFTPGTLWSSSGSTPIADIRGRIFSIHEKTGQKPNKFVMGARVWEILQDHPDFTARISGGATVAIPTIVKRQLLAQVLELEEVLVAEGVENTATEGATDSFSFIQGKNALLVHAAKSPGILIPSAGYTFSWTGHLGAGNQGQRIKRFRIEPRAADRIEIEMAYDQKLVTADLGAFFLAVVV